MSDLAIGNLGRPDEGSWFVLQGADQPGGLISTDYGLNPSLEPLVEEKLTLNLRGSKTKIRSIIDNLESLLRTGTEFSYMPLVLRIWSEDQSSYLYSLIQNGRLEIAKGQLASHKAGSMQLHLFIQRENSFFGSEQPLPLSNSSGGGITNGLTIYNHDDNQPGHDNWFTIDTAALGLIQPASLRLELENTYAGDSLSNLWVGGLADTVFESRPMHNLEAEGGSGGSALTSSLASGGKYAHYEWSGSSWTNLAAWTIGPVEVSQLRKRTCTPILRLFSQVSGGPLYLRLQISVDNKIVWQSPETELENGSGFVVLEPLNLPMGRLPLANYAYSHQLVLQAKHTATGGHALNLDDILLLPHEPFSVFHSISGLPHQSRLVVDGMLKTSWSIKQGLEIKTHRRMGEPLSINPSHKQHFWLFQTDANGAPIERTLKIRAWIRKHWRLP